MEKRHPEFFDLLRELVIRGQVELIGGGFYEPILIAIPFEDRLEQIKRLADYIAKHFGRPPTGAWLAERVWEPQLPTALANASVEYTLVDDSHFLSSGFEPEQLYGYYRSEDLGAQVSVIPGLQKLRYLIPFRGLEQTIAYLREGMLAHPGGMAAMGDDCEKFGVWPGTYEWCYTKGWLDSFFRALEENSDWLVTSPPADYLAAHGPLGRAALAAASYMEMDEWALPAKPQRRFHEMQQEFAERPDVLRFLRGGFWRNFFVKYAESNLLHKKMLYVAGKLRAMDDGSRRGLPFRRAVADARTRLLRAQCNDAYWHGIFGGLYSPHLRTALWQELIRAEKAADIAAAGHASYSEMVRQDFDADGAEEVYFSCENYAALAKPSDGGAIAALDFRPRDVALINSLERRLEASHAKLAEADRG
ncbi:MAG: alpha-amylase/4-alpha-glucanotransferase domain-containing protein, partial [Candidatus Acidiferrales bacterium]